MPDQPPRRVRVVLSQRRHNPATERARERYDALPWLRRLFAARPTGRC